MEGSNWRTLETNSSRSNTRAPRISLGCSSSGVDQEEFKDATTPLLNHLKNSSSSTDEEDINKKIFLKKSVIHDKDQRMIFLGQMMDQNWRHFLKISKQLLKDARNTSWRPSCRFVSSQLTLFHLYKEMSKQKRTRPTVN